MLFGQPKLPIASVQELTALLRTKGGRASYGSSNSSGMALSELYKSAMDLPTVQVPYRFRVPLKIMRDRSAAKLILHFSTPVLPSNRSAVGIIRGLAVS